jgi:hypothetical protein
MVAVYRGCKDNGVNWTSETWMHPNVFELFLYDAEIKIKSLLEKPFIMLSHLVYTFFRSALTLIWYGNAASMVNRISCESNQNNSLVQQLTSDTVIEVTILK